MQGALDVVAVKNGEEGVGAEIQTKDCATPELELFPLCSAAGFDEYNFGHIESQILIGHTGGDIQRELNIQD